MYNYNPSISQQILRYSDNMTQNYVTCSINFFGEVNTVLLSIVKHNREEDRCVKTNHTLYPVSIFVLFQTDDENRYMPKNRWLDVCS